jgi:hypothetical protein
LKGFLNLYKYIFLNKYIYKLHIHTYLKYIKYLQGAYYIILFKLHAK